MSMTSREQFEAWYLESWGRTEDNHDDSLFEKSPHDGEYYRFGVRLAWKAWQAASKASEQQLAAVVAESAGLKSAKEIIRHLNANREEANFCGIDDCHIDDAVAAMITPATDAAIANIQAQGVEMFAERKRNEMMSLHPDTHAVGSIAAAMSAEVKELREFAAQLRQGAKS